MSQVTEDDLEVMEMPKLQARRFLTAAQEIPIPAQRPMRAADTVRFQIELWAGVRPLRDTTLSASSRTSVGSHEPKDRRAG